MDKIRSDLRLEFLGYTQDNWKYDFEKLKKQWLNSREKKRYTFDNNFTMYLNVVSYKYCEWDPPQKIYNKAMEIIAKDVVSSISDI